MSGYGFHPQPDDYAEHFQGYAAILDLSAMWELLHQEEVEVPSKSKVQQHLAGMELDRKRKGKKPVSDMGASLSTAQLTDFASTPHAELPDRLVKKAPKTARKGKKA